MHPAPAIIDPELLARSRDLELLARGVVEGATAGSHAGPRLGSSIEFAQYRPYVQGDDPRHVDWRLYARADRLHVKQFAEETNLRCTLLLDCSASMEYGSGALAKFEFARSLTACLAFLLAGQRDAVGLIAFHEEVEAFLPARSDRNHRRRLMTALAGLKPGRGTRPRAALEFIERTLRPRGMVVLVSDLLHPLEEMAEQMRILRARRHEVIILQIADPAEAVFPFDRAATFIDAETRAEVFTAPAEIRAAYLENRARHFAEVRRLCAESEIDLEEFSTAEPLDRALRQFIRRRGRALMTTSLKRGRPAAGAAR